MMERLLESVRMKTCQAKNGNIYRAYPHYRVAGYALVLDEERCAAMPSSIYFEFSRSNAKIQYRIHSTHADTESGFYAEQYSDSFK